MEQSRSCICLRDSASKIVKCFLFVVFRNQATSPYHLSEERNVFLVTRLVSQVNEVRIMRVQVALADDLDFCEI